MPSVESTSIDCPTRYAFTVVDLLQRSNAVLSTHYGAVRLLQNVRVRRSAFRLHEPVSSRWDRDAPEVSRFSCMLFLDVLGVCDHAGPCVSSRSSAAAGFA